MLLYLKSILQLILSPAHGWEDVAKDAEEPRYLAFGGLYPMIALTSLTTFLALFYDSEATFVPTLIKSIEVFLIFFLGYFIGIWIFSIILPTLSRKGVDEKKIQTFGVYSTGLLALIWLVSNVLPMKLTIIYFLPLYVMIVQWKGWRYLGVDSRNQFKFVVLSIVGFILPPYLLYFLFSLILI